MFDFDFKERKGFYITGWPIFLLMLLILCVSVIYLIQDKQLILWSIVAILDMWLLGGGLFVIRPNEAKVLMFFGHYVGSVRRNGMMWTIPFFRKITVSLRIVNFETNKLKVNDNEGNPVEVAAIVVWRVVDTAKALFDVENYNDFVRIQSEAALRSLVMQYAYEDYQHRHKSLIQNMDEVTERLKSEVQERLHVAGIEVLEARISHLAYAPEIAAAMLQRQQAKAIVAARTEIVDGAVGMVEMALQKIQDKGLVEFDDQTKAKLISNLMIVLVSDQNAMPVVETTMK